MSEDSAKASITTTDTETKNHLRGSLLLVSGRIIALVLNFVGHVLIVRYLSKQDYGSYAFALSMATMASVIATFGLNTGFSRFTSIYREKQDYPHLFGSMVFLLGSAGMMGCILAAGIYGIREILAGTLITDPLSMTLLLVLLLFIPLNALDRVFESALAVFAKPKAIFFRRHIFGPLLKLTAIVSVIGLQGDVRAMAISFLAAIALGLLCYGILFLHALRTQALLQHFSLRSLAFSPRRWLMFSVPMLASDLGKVFRISVAVLLLEFYRGSSEVALFRAVGPLADLSKLILINFGLMFIPQAARYFARGETHRINELYWSSSAWITLLTLPLFMICFGLARPITILLYDESYADSATVLSLLSLGHFVHAAFGFNTAVLKAYGCARKILQIEFVSCSAAILLFLFVIPRWGVNGAAAAVCGASILHNAITQWVLARYTNVDAYRSSIVPLYLSSLVAGFALYIFETFVSPPLILGLLMASALSLIVIRSHSSLLLAEELFPKLSRVVIIRMIFGFQRHKQR